MQKHVSRSGSVGGTKRVSFLPPPSRYLRTKRLETEQKSELQFRLNARIAFGQSCGWVAGLIAKAAY